MTAETAASELVPDDLRERITALVDEWDETVEAWGGAVAWTPEPWWVDWQRRRRRLLNELHNCELEPPEDRQPPRRPLLTAEDQEAFDLDPDYCWRCDARPAVDDIGLCKPCRVAFPQGG